MKISRREKKRAVIFSILFVLWVLFIVVTLFKFQVLHYNEYLTKIKAQSNRILKLHAKRGTIYDRNGEILAISVKAKSAFLSSRDVSAALRIFSQVRKKINLSWGQYRSIKKRIRRGDKFIWVKRKLSESEYHNLRNLKLAANPKASLNFIDEYKRVYPQNRTACHVLGGVGIDEQGLSGIEYSLDREIRGRGGEVEGLIDARKKIFELNFIIQPVSGKNVYLTIDSTCQFIVERELEKTIRKYQARSGSVIIMDATDGAVLTMASYPYYYPEKISSTAFRILKNRAVSFLYDPGSTFKVILAAAALEANVCRPNQIFNCFNGVFHIRDRTINDVVPYRWLSFKDIIVFSSNIGASRIGFRLGKRRLFEFIKKFGFGSKTNIEVPSEERGILQPLRNWSEVSVAFLSFGYEIAVTPLQMIQAYNVLASDGYLVHPYIIKDRGGKNSGRQSGIRILSPTTLNRMLSIMCEVVDRGTGKKAKIVGLKIAGKTGTAQKVKNGKYTDRYVSSFGGFLPVKNPAVTIFITIDEPVGAYYGGDVAAPLFRRIAEKLFLYLKVFPETKTMKGKIL